MESIIKELPLPKEATKMIEEVPALKELIEPEPSAPAPQDAPPSAPSEFANF